MHAPSPDRRHFLHAVAGSAALGLLPGAAAAEPAAPPSEFLLAPGVAYLNTGTIGPCRRATLEAAERAWVTLEANPVAHYGRFAGEALIEDARTVAARFLGCDLDELAVTTSTTSGMNAIAEGLRLAPGDRVLLTDQEHAGGLHCWQYLARHHGVLLDVVNIPRGEFDAGAIVDAMARRIGPATRVVSVSHVFSSTGLRMPIAELSALAHARGALCVVDGAQAVGAVRVNVRELGCDAYATSGHKWLMGPKGTGLLYIAREAQARIRPMAFEATYATYSASSGVVNLPGLLGLAEAIRFLERAGMPEVERRNLALRHALAERVRAMRQLTIVSPPAGALASPLLTLLLAERFDRSAVSRALLERHGVAIRATHPEFGFNGIRFSFHEFNTDGDVERAAVALRAELAG
ncbi:MAG: aminotransferase class V-fold PLP-dependent enzyme [Gemmatimonadetes bacterium]|nr:aminotransferase class V-fold PLP-dependent enzyme [Gemmatimonadota bacterium]